MHKQKREYWFISLNSIAFLLIAYLFLFFLHNLTLAVAASFFDINSKISTSTVLFYLTDNSWGFDSVKTTFSSGVIVLLLIGTFFLVIYHKFKELPGILKLFFFWGYIVAYTLVFGSILVGSFANTGFGHVLSWSYIGDTGKMLHVIIALAGLSLTGVFSVRASLLTANTYFNDLDNSNRKDFILHQLIYPLVAGSIILFLIKLPIISKYEFYDIFVQFSLVIPVFIIYLGTMWYTDLMFDEEKKEIKLRKSLLITALTIIAVYRVVLGFGINI